jgi:hypothetical protein
MTTGARKLDEGKPPVMRGVLLRFPRAILEIARVSAAGTTKYGVPISDVEYKNVPDGEGRYLDALGRHLIEEAIHGPTNTETGGELPGGGVVLLHAAQAAWDALARLEIYLEREARAKTPDEPELPFGSGEARAKTARHYDGRWRDRQYGVR